MNLQITVTNKEEAFEAIRVLEAYTGHAVVAQTDSELTDVETPKKPVKTKNTKVEKEPESSPEPDESEVEEPKKPASKKSTDSVTLKELTAIAKEAVERTDRATAKDVISKYGSKLSEVDESDYNDLAEELKALGE